MTANELQRALAQARGDWTAGRDRTVQLIKEAREREVFSVIELAEITGLSRTSIYNLLGGTRSS